MRCVAAIGPIVLATLLAWTSGCSDSPSGLSQTPADSLPGLIISGPVPLARGASVRESAPGSPAGASVVYVSLPPGSVPEGLQATIRDPATGQSVATLIVDGGFDPVGLAAGVGDTLTVDITRSGSAGPIHGWELVKANRPPVVVRTDPPPQKVDVPLNSIMIVVFSEPINGTTVTTQSVGLLSGGRPVNGRAVLAPDELRVEFRPDQALAPSTAYALAVTTDVADLMGDHLEQTVTVDFTTGRATTRVVAVTITPPLAHIPTHWAPVTLHAIATDSSGAVLSLPASWASSNLLIATVDSTGQLFGLVAGTATITATVGGIQATAPVTVLPDWSSVRFDLVGDSLPLRLGQHVRIVATGLDASGSVVDLSGYDGIWTCDDESLAPADTFATVACSGDGTIVLHPASGDSALVKARGPGFIVVIPASRDTVLLEARGPGWATVRLCLGWWYAPMGWCASNMAITVRVSATAVSAGLRQIGPAGVPVAAARGRKPRLSLPIRSNRRDLP